MVAGAGSRAMGKNYLEATASAMFVYAMAKGSTRVSGSGAVLRGGAGRLQRHRASS